MRKKKNNPRKREVEKRQRWQYDGSSAARGDKGKGRVTGWYHNIME